MRPITKITNRFSKPLAPLQREKISKKQLKEEIEIALKAQEKYLVGSLATVVLSCGSFVLSGILSLEPSNSAAHQTKTEMLQNLGIGSLVTSGGFFSVSAFLGRKLEKLEKQLEKENE